MRSAGSYKRRLPWVGQPTGPTVVVPALRPLLAVKGRQEAARFSRGLVLLTRVPRPGASLVAGPVPRVTRGFSPRPTHRGLVLRVRPPMKVPAATSVAKLLPPRVVRFDPHVSLRAGRVVRGGILFPAASGLSGTPDRVFALRAAVGTTWQLRASVATTWRLRAGTMSIASNIAFFQGEDLTLNFQLVPAQDMTGWTLQASVKDKLGGSLQFSPSAAIDDAGRGLFHTSWPRANTSLLSPGDYVWDVRRVDSGFNTVLAHGEATCKQPVTS